MKEELSTILRYLEHDKGLFPLRNAILELDVSQSVMLENTIEDIHLLISQDSIKNHDYLGYYYFFLGCVYYEKGEYVNVIKSLESRILQLGEAHTNKSLAHWLLGASYSHINQHYQARRELQEALRILNKNMRINTQQREQKYAIQQKINEALVNLQANTLNQHKIFSEIISQLQIPEEENRHIWTEWKESIGSMELDPLHISDQIKRLMIFLKLETINILTEVPFINIFLAHCYNLDYFFSENKQSLSSAIEHAEDAIVGFSRDELNQALAHWYVALLYSNRSDIDTCQSHLVEADYLLETLLGATKYTNSNFYKEAQNTKKNLGIWINKFKYTNSSIHFIKPTKSPEIRESQKSNRFMDAIKKTFSPSNTSFPEPTSYEEPSEDTSPMTTSSDKPHTIHITIPIDINALKNMPVNSDCLTPDLAKKLRDFTKSIK